MMRGNRLTVDTFITLLNEDGVDSLGSTVCSGLRTAAIQVNGVVVHKYAGGLIHTATPILSLVLDFANFIC